MKLKLSNEGDVQILLASESVTFDDIKILKAGVSNLFKNGKNKVIFELTSAQSLPSEVVRELAVLDIFARELSGRVLVAGLTPETMKAIEGYSKPPLVGCFLTRQEAIKALNPDPKPKPEILKETPKPVPATETKAPPSLAPVSPAASGAPADDVQKEIENLRAKIREQEAGELGALKKKVTILEEENGTLRAQLLSMFMERKTPFDPHPYEEKILSLEKQIEEKLQEVKK